MSETIFYDAIWGPVESDPRFQAGVLGELRRHYDAPSSTEYVDYSPRTGGGYVINRSLIDSIYHPWPPEDKARLTTWLIDQRKLGYTRPEITWEALESIKGKPPLPIHERAVRLLRFIAEKTPTLGTYLTLEEDPNSMDPFSEESPFHLFLEFFAYSESIEVDSVLFLLGHLLEQGWLYPDVGGVSSYVQAYSVYEIPRMLMVTVAGHSMLEERRVQPDSAQAFIAMWFDPSMGEVREKGIKAGVQDAGYKPLVIDEEYFPGKIDDEIIAEIRRSRFLVADFTHGDDGVRGAVSYEAGFAYGLDKPVIFTCKVDQVGSLPFDTRQYSHILWKDADDLRQQLTNRIRRLLGDGPAVSD